MLVAQIIAASDSSLAAAIDGRLAATDSAQVAVAFMDLGSGASFFRNPDTVFHAASTMRDPRKISATVRIDRLGWQLRTMPHTDDPHDFLLDPIEESIGANDDLPVREAAELRDSASGLGEASEPLERLGRSCMESTGRARALREQVRDDAEELPVASWCESDLHAPASRRSRSASARTLSSSRPLPLAISRSPVARIRRIARSRSPCS